MKIMKFLGPNMLKYPLRENTKMPFEGEKNTRRGG